MLPDHITLPLNWEQRRISTIWRGCKWPEPHVGLEIVAEAHLVSVLAVSCPILPPGPAMLQSTKLVI